MFTTGQIFQAEELLNLCRNLNLHVATAESCTGGLIAACLTAVPGSSDVFDRGFVAYDNAAKTELLGVPEASIATFGAVSKTVACAMAEGALANSAAQTAVATTGIAGPDGATPAKPVGLVHIAVVSIGSKSIHSEKLIKGSRFVVRLKAMEEALSLLSVHLSESHL